jgi:protein-L-isoaspartate(D-aspartate) O-methyltransferase
MNAGRLREFHSSFLTDGKLLQNKANAFYCRPGRRSRTDNRAQRQVLHRLRGYVMSDYAAQRKNMVDSQLRTNQVTDHRILRAMMDIEREKFLPEELRAVAYMDQDIKIGEDEQGHARYMMSPMVTARLVQLAGIGDGDVVLVIGCSCGYLTALAASLASSVVCLEADEKMMAKAAANLEELGCDNAATVSCPLEQGYSKEAPFDVIIFNGGVEMIPSSLFDQLRDGGRMVAVQAGSGKVGRAHLYRKMNGTIGESRVSFDASARPLPGFERPLEFIF